MTNLLSTNAQYSKYQCIDTNIQRIHLIIIPYTLLQATYDKHEIPNGPFSQSWSHIIIVRCDNNYYFHDPLIHTEMDVAILVAILMHQVN